MEYTGERVIPKKMRPTNGMLREHIARYQFASRYAHGRVLDIASGAGYGSQILLESPSREAITEIVGVDVSYEAVNYARWHYGSSKARFLVGNAIDTRLSTKLGQFDVVISFETIEHIAEDQQFVANLYQLTKPGGTAIISTPFGRGRGKPCGDPFHVWQYTPDEFAAILSPFPERLIYHQTGETIELPQPDKRYWLGVAVCTKRP